MSNRLFTTLTRTPSPRWTIGYLVLLTLSLSSPGLAQWQVLKSFPHQVRSIYFLDHQGAASTGFVGLVDGEIWRTTDDGSSWTQSPTPLPNLVGIPVSSFAFKDTKTGWAGISANSSYNGVWKTTDGGVSWTRLPSIAGNIVSLGFATTTGQLFAVSWSGQAQRSTDDGTTWVGFAPQYQNGVWFEGPIGVISNLRAPTFLFTSDGGQNWTASNPALPTECWSPWAFSGGSVFVAVSEKSREVFVTSDGGMSWNLRYTFPSSQVPRGCVMGGGTELYVQTSQGFFVSHDTARTWFPICGPSNDLDTRFYVKGLQIFSGELGTNLWFLPNAGASGLAQLHYFSESYHAFSARCTSQDSVFSFKLNSTCSTVLTSVRLLSDSLHFHIETGSLPRSITGVGDSVRIRYTPGSARKDSSLVALRFVVAGRTLDTTVWIFGTASDGVSRVTLPTIIGMTLASACTEHDTSFTIENTGCDSITILSAIIDDPSRIQLGSIDLPRPLAAGDSLKLHLTAGAHLSGSYYATLRLRMRGSSGDFDTLVTLWLSVLRSSRPILTPLILSVPDRCLTLDTAMRILNPNCDSIQILSVAVSDTTVFHVSGVQYPFTVRSNEVASIGVRTTPERKGSYSATLRIHYRDAERYEHDTSMFVVLDVQRNLPVVLTASSTWVDLGVVNAPCGAQRQAIQLWNTLCAPVRIVEARWVGADTEFSVSLPRLPLILGSGDSTALTFLFEPKEIGKKTKQLLLTLEVDGVRRDTSVFVTGIGRSFFDARVIAPLVVFDSLPKCETRERVARVLNTSCEDLVVTQIEFGGNNGYALVSPTLPYRVRPGDTAAFLVQLSPVATGAAIDSLQIWLRTSTDQTEHVRSIRLEGLVQASSQVPRLDADLLRFEDLQPCMTKDSALTLSVDDPCASLTVSSITVTGDLKVLVEPERALPDTVRLGQPFRARIHVPSVVDTLLSAQIHIRGDGLDTVVAVWAKASSSGRSLDVLPGDASIYTRPCISSTITRTLVNSGCNAVLIDSLLLEGQGSSSQMIVGVEQSIPKILAPGEQLAFTVTFDPDRSGEARGSVRVTSSQARFDTVMTFDGGLTASVPVLRVGLDGELGSRELTQFAGRNVSVNLRALDDVSDTINLQSLRGSVSFDPNLLVLRDVKPQGDWAIVSTSEWRTGMMQLELSHTAAPIRAGDVICEIVLAARVSDSTETTIQFSDLRLNPNNPDFERCTLSSLLSATDLHFTVRDTCGTDLMRHAMTGTPFLQIIGVSPNPARGTSITVTLYSSIAQHIDFDFVSADGTVDRTYAVDIESGMRTVSLPISGLSSGLHMCRARSADIVISRPVVIAR